MIITKMALPRRTFLRGMGAALALPLLDAMVPALSMLSKSAAAATATPRMAFFYAPNGTYLPNFHPTAVGRTFELDAGPAGRSRPFAITSSSSAAWRTRAPRR